MATVAAPAVSIGNYKGVMLCNRPFVGGTGTNKGPAPASKQAFVCGNVGDKPGINVPISSKERGAHVDLRPKSKTALQKHKKWLEELRATKEELDKQYADEAAAKAERQRKFMQREARMRAVIRKTKQRALVGEEEDASPAESKEAESKVEAEAKLRRPMWALTEQQAGEASELLEGDKAEDLLAFAQNLDFDKYITDSEVSALIENVRSRIKELEAADDNDDDATAKSEASIDRKLGSEVRKAMQLTAANLKSFQQKKDDDEAQPKEAATAAGEEEDAASVAQSLLDVDKALGSIHSKKSLAAVAERTKQTAEAARSSNKKLLAVDEEPPMPEPVVVKHCDDEGSRLEAKKAISNLPYMHRNPAV
ncbi:hypothetical protein CTAYLR_007647 [Chrysophaeum taylorii]|uniref:Uncharacterized protein n=1 Tax=Chrysophaeum taylorii TaxID=2483200 RepID=A0AAD7U567_9STRA|nr:hypothetical protein CTAYLR_007647 [Chrysophaeum taylorii]